MSALSAHNLWRRIGGALRRMPFVTGPLAALAGFAALAFWAHNVSHLLGDTAPVVSLDRLEARLAPGQSVIIGRRELLQGEGGASGEREHVEITHGAGGRVLLRNVARQKRLWLDYAEGGVYSARWRLQTGDVIATPGATLTVAARDGASWRLQLQAGRERRDIMVTATAAGSAVSIDGNAAPVCAEPSLVDRLRSTMRGYLAGDDRGEDRVADLGGLLTCQVRDEHFIAAPALPFRAFSLTRRGDDLYFAPGEAAAGIRPPVQFRRGGQVVEDFAGVAWDVDPPGPDELRHVVIGRTRYRVEAASLGADRVVTLTPVSKLHRMSPSEAQEILADLDNPALKVVPTPARRPFSRAEMSNLLSDLAGPERAMRLALALGLAGLSALGAAWRLREARSWNALGAAPLALGALGLVSATALLALSPEAARLIYPSLSFEQSMLATIAAYGLATLAVTLSSAFGAATRLFWVALIGLIALGNLTLLSLAVDSPRTDFAAHVHKNKLLFVDIVPIMAMLIATMPASMAAAWPRSFFAGAGWRDNLGRLLPSLLLIAGLAAWAVLGTETGVGGFQPVELGKIALVLVLAHVFAGFLRIDMFYGQRQYLAWLALSIGSALTFFLFLTSIPFLKSDYSPILIILITTVALAFSFLAPGVIQRIGRMAATLRARRAAPQPRFPQLGWPRGGALALVLLMLLGVNLALVALFPALASKAITGAWSIPKDRIAAIELLEQARGGALRVPAERLLTWYDLDHGAATAPAASPTASRAPTVLHRDLGLQLLMSKLALAQAPCALTRLDAGFDKLAALSPPLSAALGAEPQAALCAFVPGWPREGIGGADEEADQASARFTVRDLLRVPVIQNDFIATYVLTRFGLPAGIALVTLQVLMAAALLMLAVSLRFTPGVGFQDQGARAGLSIVAAGAAALFAVHWMISWGNAIGVLPVMGQPMTLIAAATSHHMLMALPAIGLALLAGRVDALRPIRVDRSPPRW